MQPFPGPVVLGRGIVVETGQDPPAECSGWPRVVLDAAAIAAPADLVALLHDHWLTRRPVVIVLDVDPGHLRAPETSEIEPWRLDPSFEFSRERLQFLTWSNNYDLRTGEPIWWHGRRAVRLGAAAASGGAGDVVLADGNPAWCDGGPRQPMVTDDGAVVVHRESVEAGSLQPDRIAPPLADLAPDQLAAVAHVVGSARVIAPAGSGKTRVLTERLRHLLVDRGVTPATVMAVAYNTRAAGEMAERTDGLPAHIRTLNSLGLAIVNRTGPFAAIAPAATTHTAAQGGRRLVSRQMIDEPEVRRIIEELVQVRHQQNSDPYAPYLDALSAIRLGLRSPAAVEEAIPDAAGVSEIFDQYRARLAERNVLDFDEQIYAAIETLLRDPGVRAAGQRAARHLLVDEFQDLTPAHLLLLRLLAAPTYDVFGVGDDDQVIYSYASATPAFLIDYESYFPGATHYALEVNYRCPPAVVDGARHLVGYNTRRIPKTIRPAPGRVGRSGDVHLDRSPDGEHAEAARAHIDRWRRAGAEWADIAVLARVNSALLAVQVTLVESGVPCSTPLSPAILTRTGIRTALAYLRIAADPGRIHRGDVAETIRRPSRKIARNVAEMLQKRSTTSLSDMRRLARALSGNDAGKVDDYGDDLEHLGRVAEKGTTADVLRAVRLDIGLGGALDVLDSSRREADRSTHLDDLAALEQVAALHPEVATFEAWLGNVLSRRGAADGVVLSTIHRVKGQEWPHVVVFGADLGLFPHRLATDVEEERRIFHVALTRAIDDVVIIADTVQPSPFCDELDGGAPHDAARVAGRAAPALPMAGAPAKRGRKGDGSRAVDPRVEGPLAALKAWRSETAGRTKMPAYVVFNDDTLIGIAEAMPATLRDLLSCRGVGPAKIDKYGDEVLAVLEPFMLSSFSNGA